MQIIRTHLVALSQTSLGKEFKEIKKVYEDEFGNFILEKKSGKLNLLESEDFQKLRQNYINLTS